MAGKLAGIKALVDNAKKEARKAKQTEFELAQAEAQRVAALPVEEGGLGLPADNTRQDRARALGYDVPVYHGSNKDFREIDLSKSSRNVDYMPGFFTANTPEIAANYGDIVYPLLQKRGVQITDKRMAKKQGNSIPEIDTVFDKERGVNVTNNPSNIRSPNAAFNPAKKDSSDILASLGLGTAAGAGMLYTPEENKAEAGIISKMAKGVPLNEKELMFLHNTSPEKLKRIEEMGGMPMPSIAVTKKDIPFEGFGDITLVGKPERFDPKIDKRNQAFTADAYTVRAPRPVRIAKKGAGRKFQKDWENKYKSHGHYIDNVSSSIWGLEKKSNMSENEYNDVANFIERNSKEVFLEGKGIKVPKDSRGNSLFEELESSIKPYIDSGEYQSFVKDRMDEIFETQQYFIANPNRDYYSQNARLKPYTAEEVTKYMAKNAGSGGEGGMALNSAGGVRSSTTQSLKSLDAMRAKSGQLVSPSQMEEFKQTSTMMLDDLEDAFRNHYDYDRSHYGYSSEFREMVRLSEKVGIKKAMKEIGFSNVSDELIKELQDYKDMLRNGPTEYFESKPKRVVELTDFGGAIVPQDAPIQTIERLKNNGIAVEFYDPNKPETKLEARKKFQDLAFALGGGVAITAGLAAPQDAEAGLITKGGKQLIEAYHGTPHTFAPTKENPLGAFDMSRMGTGEGAQVYGHGLYFADSPKVAKQYRETLSGATDVNAYEIEGNIYERGTLEFKALSEINNGGKKGAKELLKIYKEDLSKGEKYINEDYVSRYEKLLLSVGNKKPKQVKGAIYKTEIDATPDELLDWDKPIKENIFSPTEAKNLITEWEKKTGDKWDFGNFYDQSGQGVYQMLSDLYGPESASQLLLSKGIKGIQYDDQMSRGKKNGTKNYVVFDDKLLNITERGNIDPRLAAATAAGAGAALTMMPQDAEASTLGPVQNTLPMATANDAQLAKGLQERLIAQQLEARRVSKPGSATASVLDNRRKRQMPPTLVKPVMDAIAQKRPAEWAAESTGMQAARQGVGGLADLASAAGAFDIAGGLAAFPMALTGNIDAYNKNIQPLVNKANEPHSDLGLGMQMVNEKLMEYIPPEYLAGLGERWDATRASYEGKGGEQFPLYVGELIGDVIPPLPPYLQGEPAKPKDTLYPNTLLYIGR